MKITEFEINQEMAPLVKPPIEKLQLVKYAGASGDFNMIHIDEETALKSKLPGIIAHGMLSMGFLGQLISGLAGDDGFVSRLQVRFSGMVLLGESVTCRAKVTAKDEEKKTVDFAITAETAPGKITTVGNASIKFY